MHECKTFSYNSFVLSTYYIQSILYKLVIMERWQNKVAVVTGASSGIGAAIVKDLIAAGLIVVGLARRQERVEELRAQLDAKHKKQLHAFKCDVSQLESVNAAFDWIEKTLGGIDILVNNAGTAKFGQLSTMDVETVQMVLQTNVMGVVYCTQRAFKSMKERDFAGHVVLINSILGHNVMANQPGQLPRSNIYPSSKFAITAMNEIYRQEFSALGTKVKVTSISPGLVATELVSEELQQKMADRILEPKDISQGVLFAISTPPHVQIHEMTIKPVGEMA